MKKNHLPEKDTGHHPLRGPHNLLQLTLPRIATVRKRIESMVWQHLTDLPCYIGETTPNRISLQKVKKNNHTTMSRVTPGAVMGEQFHFTWYRIDIPVDVQYPEPLHLQWRHNGESTIYIDDFPYAGYDRQHAYHRIPGSATEIWVEVMHMLRNHSYQGASLYNRNDIAWKAIHDIDMLFDIAKANCDHFQLPFGNGYNDAFGFRQPPEYLDRFTRRLLRVLDDAATAFEKHGLDRMSQILDNAYELFTAHHQGLRLSATAQAHLDPIFSWPEIVGDFKTIHTFASANRLMEEYPEMTFEFSQPVLYEKVGSLEPKLMEMVRKRMEQGLWEMEGGLYAESDVQLPCGEALARSMLLGQKVSERISGKNSVIIWLPDTFGFSACLPQIMQQCGIRYFYTTKMHWNTITHFPYSSFRWIGNDGTEVIAHLSQHYMGYMLNGLPSQLRNVENIYRQSDVHDESIAPIGFGDGGGGITAEQIERVRRARNLYSVPKTEFGNVRTFFDNLKNKRNHLPEFRGELYLEYHRGVSTSRRRIKELYRACERELQILEAIHSAKKMGPIQEAFWKRMALMQFHDVLPGSAISLACNQVCEELERLKTQLRQLSLAALQDNGNKGTECVFNPLPFEQIAWCKNPANGNEPLLSIPPLSGIPLANASEIPAPGEVEVEKHALRNDYCEINFDTTGRIASMIVDDRTVRFEQPANQLICYREMPAMFDVWEIDRQSLSEGFISQEAAQVEIVDSISHRKSLRYTKTIGEKSAITIMYTLEADARELKITYEIDWHDPETLLKAHFPTKYQASHARFGCPFGSILRPSQPGHLHDDAQWESVGNRWACVFDEGEMDGLFIATKNSYGFGCYRGDLNLSLVRSPIPPECDMKRLGKVLLQDKRNYASDNAETIFTDIGHHSIEIIMGLYDSRNAFNLLPPVIAESAFTQPLCYTGRPIESPLPAFERSKTIIPYWVQPLDNKFIVRMHEVLGRHDIASLTDTSSSTTFYKNDLRGNRLIDTSHRSVECRPYEVLNLEFTY